MSHIIYLASPYSHEDLTIREERYQAVAREAGLLINEGNVVFSPIAHSHPIAVYGKVDGGWETWVKQDLAILARCDEFMVLMLPGWEHSTGIQVEELFADEHDIPVTYRNPRA